MSAGPSPPCAPPCDPLLITLEIVRWEASASGTEIAWIACAGDSNTASRLAHGRDRTVPAGRGRLCPARPRVPAVLLAADRRGRLPGWRHRRAKPAGAALRSAARAGQAAVHLHAVR